MREDLGKLRNREEIAKVSHKDVSQEKSLVVKVCKGCYIDREKG